MTYTTKNGAEKNTYFLSSKRMNEMCAKGWRVKADRTCRETAQDVYDRLSRCYAEVRIYECSTSVRGLRDIFAMCK